MCCVGFLFRTSFLLHENTRRFYKWLYFPPKKWNILTWALLFTLQTLNMFNVCWQLLPIYLDIPTKTKMYENIMLLVDRSHELRNIFYKQCTLYKCISICIFNRSGIWRGIRFSFAIFVNKRGQYVFPEKSFLETKLAKPCELLGHFFCVCRRHLLKG